MPQWSRPFLRKQNRNSPLHLCPKNHRGLSLNKWDYKKIYPLFQKGKNAKPSNEGTTTYLVGGKHVPNLPLTPFPPRLLIYFTSVTGSLLYP